MRKSFLIIGIILSLFFTINFSAASAESSVSACGYVFVHHEDGTWSVYKNGHIIETYSSGWNYSDIKEKYCS